MQALQMIFGLTHSVLCLFLKFSMRLLFKVLASEHHAKVSLPSPVEMEHYKDIVLQNFADLNGVWCMMDGLKIPIQASGDRKMPNAYYIGWLHDHFVNAVFVFAPSGTIVVCTLNAPGSWHDSFIEQNGGLYDKLDKVFNTTGGKCVVDAAFLRVRCPYLVKSGEKCIGDSNLLENRVKVQPTSLRHAAEWGMRALQGSFP
jgi:hypothetical protein